MDLENCKFGVEIELFGITRQSIYEALTINNIDAEIQTYNHVDSNCWKITYDGSVTTDGTEPIMDLHGEMVMKGIEVVSPPLIGYDGLKQLKIVCNVLEELGAKVDKTCGLHIHLDNTNLTPNNVKNILIFHYNNQIVIDSMFAEERRSLNCGYCKCMTFEEINKIRKCKTKEKMGYVLRTRHRAVNARSYRRRPTIEYRMHNGTVNYCEIYNWLVLLYSITEYCISLGGNILIIKREPKLITQINRMFNMLGIFRTSTSKYIMERIKRYTPEYKDKEINYP